MLGIFGIESKMMKDVLEEEELGIGVKGRRKKERHVTGHASPDFSNYAKVGQQSLWKGSDYENEIRR